MRGKRWKEKKWKQRGSGKERVRGEVKGKVPLRNPASSTRPQLSVTVQTTTRN